MALAKISTSKRKLPLPPPLTSLFIQERSQDSRPQDVGKGRVHFIVIRVLHGLRGFVHNSCKALASNCVLCTSTRSPTTTCQANPLGRLHGSLRQRRAFWRGEQQSIALALSPALRHSADKTLKAKYYASRVQRNNGTEPTFTVPQARCDIPARGDDDFVGRISKLMKVDEGLLGMAALCNLWWTSFSCSASCNTPKDERIARSFGRWLW